MSIAGKCRCGSPVPCEEGFGCRVKRKPIKARPHFYACCLLPLQEIAKECGYNLIAHGSLDRDFDLIAVPWVDEPTDHFTLLTRLHRWLSNTEYTELAGYGGSKLGGGRVAYHIDLNRGGHWNNYLDEQWYLDISITPLLNHTN